VGEGDDLDIPWAVVVAVLLLAVTIVALAGFFTLGRTFLVAFIALLAVSMVVVGIWAVVAGRRTGEGPIHAFGRGCREGVIWFVSLLP
jgi:hypothetical protein